jgi:hypothetical protein
LRITLPIFDLQGARAVDPRHQFRGIHRIVIQQVFGFGRNAFGPVGDILRQFVNLAFRAAIQAARLGFQTRPSGSAPVGVEQVHQAGADSSADQEARSRRCGIFELEIPAMQISHGWTPPSYLGEHAGVREQGLCFPSVARPAASFHPHSGATTPWSPIPVAQAKVNGMAYDVQCQEDGTKDGHQRYEQ